MPGTANMSLVLPTEGDSADQWAFILDTVFGLIDSHDHSTGKGVKVPAGGLNINADVSWNSGGVSHSITDLLALDFKPSPAASVTGLAAAMFVSDGSGGLSANELYWRTTTGTNVKFTAGTALNVAAFTGGIGGDYAATGALVVFDDSTDSYWFQQQVGSTVRQYARMRSADVDLYEYKANPAAGVPTNRVRLASPAALAASYTLTMPGALSASRGGVQVDTTGQLAFVGPFSFPFSLASSIALATTSTDNGLVFGANSAHVNCPCAMPVGTVVSQWTLYVQKTSTSGTITAQLWDLNMATGVTTQVGANQTNNANNPGFITLGQSGLSSTLLAGHSLYIIFIPSGITGDTLLGWTVNGP